MNPITLPIEELLRYIWRDGNCDGVFITKYPALITALEACQDLRLYVLNKNKYNEYQLWTPAGWEEAKNYKPPVSKKEQIAVLQEEMLKALDNNEFTKVIELRNKIKALK